MSSTPSKRPSDSLIGSPSSKRKSVSPVKVKIEPGVENSSHCHFDEAAYIVDLFQTRPKLDDGEFDIVEANLSDPGVLVDAFRYAYPEDAPPKNFESLMEEVVHYPCYKPKDLRVVVGRSVPIGDHLPNLRKELLPLFITHFVVGIKQNMDLPRVVDLLADNIGDSLDAMYVVLPSLLVSYAILLLYVPNLFGNYFSIYII